MSCSNPGEEQDKGIRPGRLDIVTADRIVVGDDYRGYRMPVPARFTMDLMATAEDKWAVLESMGIQRRDGVTPLEAWRDAVADETGVPRAELDPSQGGVLDLGFTPAYVRKFVTFLA